jgi:hypothetical protein
MENARSVEASRSSPAHRVRARGSVNAVYRPRKSYTEPRAIRTTFALCAFRTRSAPLYSLIPGGEPAWSQFLSGTRIRSSGFRSSASGFILAAPVAALRTGKTRADAVRVVDLGESFQSRVGQIVYSQLIQSQLVHVQEGQVSANFAGHSAGVTGPEYFELH